VAYRIFGRSLFDVQLKRAGFDLSLGRDQAILQNRPVSAFMTRACTVLAPDDTVADVLRELGETGRGEAIVVDRGGRYVGLVRVQDTLSRAPEVRLRDIARPGEVVFDETTTIWQAMERLRGFVGEAAPLVASNDGRFLGIVPESAVIRAYLEAVHDLRREEHEAV
jgi:CIC family chloride channel protein